MEYQLPKQPIRISRRLLHDPEIDEIMSDPITRVIYLLWAPNHFRSQDFSDAVRGVGRRIMEERPKTPKGLLYCFGYPIFMPHDFQCSSLQSFCEQAFPYIMGEKEVEIEVLEQ